jgi:hypothetical protein
LTTASTPWGFQVDLGSVRAVYGRLISRHFRSVRGRSKLQLDVAVGKLEGQVARKFRAPNEALNAITDFIFECLGVFYGIDDELASSGLAALGEIAGGADLADQVLAKRIGRPFPASAGRS